MSYKPIRFPDATLADLFSEVTARKATDSPATVAKFGNMNVSGGMSYRDRDGWRFYHVKPTNLVLDLIRDISADLNRLGYSGEKYRLDISADRDTLEDMVDDLIKRVPKPLEGQSSVGVETMVPMWEKLSEVCKIWIRSPGTRRGCR